MRRFLFLIFFLGSISSHVRSQPCNSRLVGDWTLKNASRVFYIDPTYNHIIESMSEDKISFYTNGTMAMSSGFFFVTNEKWPEERYPWIYCGDFAKYKIENDSLAVLHPGYKTWIKYKIVNENQDSVEIRNHGATFLMTRNRTLPLRGSKAGVQAVEITVADSRYFIAKKMTIDRNDNLIVEDLHINHELNPRKYLRLPSGYFKFLCRKIIESDLLRADSLYSQSEANDGRGIILLLKYSQRNRSKIIRLIGVPPDFLTRALIPMIYCEDLMNYPDLWLKVDFAKY